MRFKALLALLGLGLALMLIAGCSDSEDNNRTLSGTITNAGQTVTGQATATLFRNGAQVGVPVAVGSNGRFTFNNVPQGSGYTIVVTSTATPPAFTTFTTNTFSVTGNNSNLNIDVAPTTGIVSGTVTNASTGLPLGAGDANVALFRSGAQVGTTQTTSATGGFSFANVPVASGYTIVVTSTATPAAFDEVTTSAFTVSGNTTQNVTVGTGITGETVTGTIGTSVANATFNVVAKNAAGQTVASTTTTLDTNGIPTFTLLNVPVGTVTLEATSAQVPGIITVLPLTVPQGGTSGLIFNVQDAAGLVDNGVPDTANLVAFIPGSGTITVDGTVSTAGNPTFLTVANGTYTVTVTPTSGTAVVVPNVTVSAGNVTVIRLPEFAG